MKQTNQSREISLIIERLRILRNITQEDLLHDIISLRQYRRYLSGVSEITYSILEKLSRRLGFDAVTIILELDARVNEQHGRVNNLYSLITNKDFSNSDLLLKKIDYDNLISENDKLLFKHSVNLLSYLKNEINELQMIDETSELFNFDVLIEKKVLSDIELLGLTAFLKFEMFDKKSIIADKIASHIDTNLLIKEKDVKVILLAELSKYYDIYCYYEKAYYYALIGVKELKDSRTSCMLDILYYYAIKALHKLDLFKKRDELILECLLLLNLGGNKTKIYFFSEMLKNDFNVNPKKIIEKYMKST